MASIEFSHLYLKSQGHIVIYLTVLCRWKLIFYSKFYGITFQVKTLVMNIDSKTISRVRVNVGPDILKKSYSNHIILNVAC